MIFATIPQAGRAEAKTLSIAAPVKMTALMFRPVHFAPSAMATTSESFTAELILIIDPLEQERLMTDKLSERIRNG